MQRESVTFEIRCWRFLTLLTLVCLLTACAAPATFRQQAEPPRDALDLNRRALVVLAADLRQAGTEIFGDSGQMGDVYFRRLDAAFRDRPATDHDFGIEYALGADWAALAGPDENRAPKIFALRPGSYILHKINIGTWPTTPPGSFDPVSGEVYYGVFEVRAGEVINLGRLVVHMHFKQRYFAARVEDNTDEARQVLATAYPDLAPRMTTRPLRVAERMPFGREWD